MDTVVEKLETKWPPDRKSTIEASEFGIYKEPSDVKRRIHGTDRATGCLLVLSLIAAAAVVVYFMFFDYTIQTTQTVASVGPIVSYAKYVKDQYSKSTAATVAVDRAADELLAAVLSAKHSENGGTNAAADVQVANGAAADVQVANGAAADVQVANGAAADGQVENRAAADDGVGGRRMRLYRPLAKHLSYDSEYWKTAGTAVGAVHGDAERADAFGHRSDFPQLAAYRAPFPPKSVLDVMKYVTGTSHRPPAKAAAGPGAGREYMVAQESRYVPIRPAEEVNRFLPDADAPPTGGSKRFRNKFGPPVFLTPPIMAFPDDFMKPPNTDAKFSMDFVTANAADVVLQEGSASVPSHTGVVFHQSSGMATGYPVPDAPAPAVVQQVPKKVKNGKPKNKKPISVMVDIYPLTDHEHEENEQVEDDEDRSSEMFTTFKNNMQQSDAEKLLFRLNLFPNYFSEGGRRMSIDVKKHEEENDQNPIIHLTTNKPLEDKENERNEDDEILFENEYKPESKILANISKIK